MLEALELLVLAAAPWPLYRALTLASFRRHYARFVVGILVLLTLHAAVAVSLALFLPGLLHGAALLALAGLAAERWRARSDYGKAKGLPPGSLALVPAAPRRDHRFYLEQSRRHGPIFKVSLHFRPMVCIVGAGLGSELLQSHAAALRAPEPRYSRNIPGGFLRYMEGGTHRHYRRILQTGLAPAVLEDGEAETRRQVRATLAAMARDGGSSPRPALSDMLLAILLRLFFGTAEGGGTGRRLMQLYGSIDVRKTARRSARTEKAVAGEIARLARRQIEDAAQQARQGETPPACILASIAQHHPEALADDTMLLNLVYMVQVARTDMTGLLMWILKQLGDHPETLGQLRHQLGRDPAAAPPPRLAELIVKETLRLEQSEFLSREAVADIDFKGFRIPRGWLVRVCIREGHRDPARFAEPERFDPHRFLAQSYGPREYSPLGMLGHACIGAQIVSRIGQIFVTELARSFDLAIVADGPREFGVDHWTPSSTFRIALRPRTPRNEELVA